MTLSPEAKRRLVAAAYGSVAHGLVHGRPGSPDSAHDLPELRVPAATFVTLTLHGQLRGCCGALDVRFPLLQDVWNNAYASAFRDVRFPPLVSTEYGALEVEISVLGPLESLAADCEEDVIAALVPGCDGLLLSCKDQRATFLPQVWADLADPRQFLAQLKRKAGWPPSFWSKDLQAWRYRVEHVVMKGAKRPSLALVPEEVDFVPREEKF